MSIPKGTTIPKSQGNFAKFEEGKNKFRILSDVQTGWEGWKDKKPFRHKGDTCHIKAEEVDNNQSGKPNINYFWVAQVWNYQEKKLQILEITQKTVMSALYDLEQSEEWGDLKNYDVVINKKKEGDKTSYNVIGIPPKEVDPEIKQAYEEGELEKEIEKMFDRTVQEEGQIDPEEIPF